MSHTPSQRAPLSLLLGAFAAASFGGLLLLVALVEPREEGTRHAYRPADFPAVFGKNPALDGLPASGNVIVPGFTLDKDTFPCSQCHDGKDLKTNPEPRPSLRDPHENRTVDHGGLWCLACHSEKNYDSLHLSSGELVELSNPLPLCAQCHGEKARDWKAGVHGLRTGYWNGPKRILLCVACHDPHRPKPRPIEALPPPVRPAAAAKEKS